MQRAPPAVAAADSKKRKGTAGTSKGVLALMQVGQERGLKPEMKHTLTVFLSSCDLAACIESAWRGCKQK